MDEDNVFVQMEARKSWTRARQAAGMEELLSLLPFQSAELLPFEEVKNQLRLRQRTYRGVREIPLEQIVGSVGRYRDFTRTFLPRSAGLRQRWVRVNAAAATIGVPPVEVYQVGQAYFVLDGNHRVSVARQNGARSIEAHVWEFETPAGLSAEADLNEVLIRAEYAQFLEQTRLDELRPGADIAFTVPGRYRELEWQIELYRRALEKIDEQPVSYGEAVTAWYDMIYSPAIQIIQEQGVLARFPDRTEADLFIWVWRHCQELRERKGSALLASVANEIARSPRWGILGRVWRAMQDLLRSLR
jgi:hypothetical protein